MTDLKFVTETKDESNNKCNCDFIIGIEESNSKGTHIKSNVVYSQKKEEAFYKTDVPPKEYRADEDNQN